MKKPKYKIGDSVYIRNNIYGNGMQVLKGKVTDNKYFQTSGYRITEDNGKNIPLVVGFETWNNISKRKERLVKEAKKSIEENYGGYISSYNMYLDKLNNLK